MGVEEAACARAGGPGGGQAAPAAAAAGAAAVEARPGEVKRRIHNTPAPAVDKKDQ